jgi:hypothetical protein
VPGSWASSHCAAALRRSAARGEIIIEQRVTIGWAVSFLSLLTIVRPRPESRKPALRVNEQNAQGSEDLSPAINRWRGDPARPGGSSLFDQHDGIADAYRAARTDPGENAEFGIVVLRRGAQNREVAWQISLCVRRHHTAQRGFDGRYLH